MLHQQNELIGARYRIIALQNQGGWHCCIDMDTYTAFDVHGSRSVILTVYSFKEATDWKTVKLLFERQADTLLSLDCPYIPKYLSYFEIDNINTDGKCHFYLIREPAAGKPLAELIAGGWHPNEIEVKKLGIQLLNILDYLHSQSVIHQNIEPENIIFGEKDRVCLVNFGGIENTFSYWRMRGILPDKRVAIISTNSPYQSREYYMDKPVPASDLYSVGYCLIYLLSGKSPGQLLLGLPVFQQINSDKTQIDVSPDFQRWLETMVEQETQNRFNSAAAAIRAMPIRLQADSLQLMSYPLVKNKLAIAHRLNSLKHELLKVLKNFNARRKTSSTMVKVITAIITTTIVLLIFPKLTFAGISFWLFFLGCAYIANRLNSLKHELLNVLEYFNARQKKK